MRDILYRGMNHETGKFVYGFYTKLQDGARITHNIIVEDEQAECRFTKFYIHSKETVGQFTGLTDRNGAKIFEGDKLNWIQFNFTVVCEWDNDFSRFFLKAPNKLDSIGITRFTRNEFEIIGNIHEGDK